MACITDVPGLLVGHDHDLEAVTGLTVVVCPTGAVGGAFLAGAATSTRQFGGLSAGHVVDKVHAVLFTGGSAFGLDAAAGAMTWLEQRGIGFDIGVTRVPIAPTAALFDLKIGRHDRRPDPAMARRACQAASTDPSPQGSIGAGCGATVGKLAGLDQAMKSGLGSWSVRGENGLIVGGLIVVNAFGDVWDPETNNIMAGARTGPGEADFIDAEAWLARGRKPPTPFKDRPGEVPQNTTLALVAVNAALQRRDCIAAAKTASQVLGRVIRPYATRADGDLVIVLSLPDPADPVTVDPVTIGLMGGQALTRAALNAIDRADGLGLIPARKDLFPI